MLQSKSEGPSTFTCCQIRQILRKETNTTGQPKDEFRVYPFENVYKDSIRMRVRKWFTESQAKMKGHASELEALDTQFSELLECDFLPENVEETIIGSVNLLTRIPETPLELHDPLVDPPYRELERLYFLEDSGLVWKNLRAARFVSRNTIRMALQIQISTAKKHCHPSNFPRFLDAIAEVLRTAIDLSKEQPSKEWFVIKAFFWTSWQQAMILYHHYILENHLAMHYWPMTEPLDGLDIILRALRSEGNKIEIPPYLCKWAFRLLEVDKSFISHDYRRLFQRFSQTFDNCAPRCQNSLQSCNGRQPEKCLRLSGMKIDNQSAHTYDCDKKKCLKLYWNEKSWRAIGGAAAVLLDLGCDKLLNYCESSEQTMAVSHVWSHGQGGRPENTNEGTGLNSCLHRRYAKIARSHGCNSYWMDTPCIPTDHVLRQEAIKNINRVFTNSKLTLVCDKDLMAIDVRNLNVAVQESILATILVCDWNVRAWTLLEALRGRKNIRVLCKDDLTISLVDAVRTVNQKGCIDIAVLFLLAQHLLPTKPVNPGAPEPRRYRIGLRQKTGYLSMMEAASALSYRHASRPGDEVVIWSLLTEDDPSFKAEQLWRNQLDASVPTGFLMSTLPRLSSVKGFSWAPCRPNFPLHEGKPYLDYDPLLFSYGGEGSEPTTIMPDDLSGHWWSHFSVRKNSEGQRGSENELWDAFSQSLRRKSSWASRRSNSLLLEQEHHLDYDQVLLSYGGEGSSTAIITRDGLSGFWSAYKFSVRKISEGQRDFESERWVAFLQPCPQVLSVKTPRHPQRPDKHVFATITSNDGSSWRWDHLLEISESTILPILPKFSSQGFLIM